ncbi:hypothetical protein [Terrabacter sp. NPDC080008]|uniref:hypothetical protein n=1 Tax=Terrabacter sp. NPDC080008 TaxID=3155176 RepID=UPI00344F5D0B
MKKLLTGALALMLSASLAACSTSDGSGAQPSTTGPAVTSSSTETPGTDTAAPGDTVSSAAVPTTAAPADQSTPEAAMTSWLAAMVSGDGNTVCQLMSTNGKPIPSIPGAAAACGKKITPMLDQLKELGAAFKGLKITGATVKGDTASFESVTTEPALAADVVRSFKAVRVGGKWYITQS